MLAVLLALAGVPLAPSAPVDATLDQIRLAPHIYGGRQVRVAGQLDQCWRFACSLCPLEATPVDPQRQRCLAISFDRMTGGANNAGADFDSAFRYADLVVSARFDPTCLEGVCTDRASVLVDARVEQVTRRRHSRDGLIDRADPLHPVPDEAAAPILALLGPSEPADSRIERRAFASGSERSLERSAVLCQSLRGGSEGAKWPASWQGALVARSTEDLFRCWRAQRDGGGWRLQPN